MAGTARRRRDRSTSRNPRLTTEFENNGWYRASAVIEVREIPPDAPKVPDEHESS
jgi:hypothetical protein